MKNNIKALGFHLLIVVLSMIFVIVFVVTGPTLGRYMTHIISRILITIAFILVYVFAGSLLDIGANKKYDFLTGCVTAFIGIALWYYTVSITGGDLFKISKEVTDYWILMNTYHSPFIFVNFLFRLPNTPLMSLITNLFPGLLMGIGLKYKRSRLKI